jgi:hypothetical protein
MKNEELNVVVMENEISVIEENHHNAILSIHENMQQLVADCNDIKVVEDDKETYDRAVELKRVVKSTHVAIEKKRKELKQPLIDYGKRLDKWVEGIYSPLVQAEKLVKQKMEVYEAKQEILKAERKALEDKQQAQEQEIEDKLKNLNATLGMINSASSKNELNEINSSLEKVVLSEYGKKSDEAGFILNQLKLTCSMALRLMKDEEEKPVIAPKLETTPITDDFLKELREMSAEPTKKVIVEENKDEITEQKEVSSDESFTGGDYKEVTSFDSTKEPIVADEKVLDTNSEQELTDISDDDILLFIGEISSNLMSNILPLITDYSNDYLTNVKDKNISEFQKSFIIEESLKRVGALLLKRR